MDLRIDVPIMLVLLLPVIGYFIMTYLRQPVRSRRFKTVITLRMLAVSLLVVALTSPYLLLPIKDEQILFLVDRSASMQQHEEEALTFIEESLAHKKEHHLVGIYSFAEGFQTEALLTKKLTTIPELTMLEAQGNTNIEQALQVASGIVEPKKATRIILLTDGNETTGDVAQALQRLSPLITVDTVQLTNHYQADIAVENFTSPERAFVGEMQTLVADISATEATTATVGLYTNDVVQQEQQINLQQGTNQITYQQPATAQGLVRYEVRVAREHDAIIENNTYASMTQVKAPPHVLIVQHEANATDAIARALGTSITHTTLEASELPQTLSSYLQYDAIIFDNVPGYVVGEARMQVIEQAVHSFGVGFMMTGGEMSFGLGGYAKSPIEKIVPVDMEVTGKHKVPSTGLVIVLDRSGSMSGQKMQLAKEAAVRATEMLREEDTLGFIAFDDKPWCIIDTAPMQNREQAINKILAITVGGGTEIYASLKEAYEDLAPLDLQRKHIILVTDGQENTRRDYREMTEQGLTNQTTLSTVSIGADADPKALEKMSAMGSGRFYNVLDANMIPTILARETAMISRTYIVDNPFYPRIYDVPTWSPLFAQGVPQMNAYIATTAKSGATIIADSAEDDPILAQWRYGMGTSVAFMSDASGAWAGDWAAWDNWQRFWQKAVAEILPTYNETPYAISQTGNTFTLIDPTNRANLVEIKAVNEQGEQLPITQQALTASKLTFDVATAPGTIFIQVDNGTGDVFKLGKTIPYSEEYRQQPINEQQLALIAQTAKGEVLTTPQQAFRKLTQKSEAVQSITLILIAVAMVLFFIDITLRRFTGVIRRKPKLIQPNHNTTITDKLNKQK